jgi:hypothetical protein
VNTILAGTGNDQINRKRRQRYERARENGRDAVERIPTVFDSSLRRKAGDRVGPAATPLLSLFSPVRPHRNPQQVKPRPDFVLFLAP